MVTTFTYDEDGARNFEGEGVCGGAKFFGSALLQPARSASSSERFFSFSRKSVYFAPADGVSLGIGYRGMESKS